LLLDQVRPRRGHGRPHDRQGLRDNVASTSWSSSHPSRGPDGWCSQNDLQSTGGNGLYYCFAEK